MKSNKCQCVNSIGALPARAKTEPLPCLTEEGLHIGHRQFPAISPFHHFVRGWFFSSLTRTLFYNSTVFFKCIFVNCSVVFLFLRLTRSLHLMVNPLRLWSQSLLLIIDKKTCASTSWRSFFHCSQKGVFLHHTNNLSSKLVFLSQPAHWHSLVFLAFLECAQLLNLANQFSWIALIDFLFF